jgi:hypothetical protein
MMKYMKFNLLIWKIFYFSWTKNNNEFDKNKEEISKYFQIIDLPINMFLNIISYNLFFFILLNIAGFTDDFKEFALYHITLPSLLFSIFYYVYKFGFQMVFAINIDNITKYLNNWILMFNIGIVSSILILFLHQIILQFEYFLPEGLKGVVYFPIESLELYWKRSIYIFYGFCFILLLFLPISVKGYHYNMNILGQNGRIGYVECAIEIIYMTCNSSTAFMHAIPYILILQKYFFKFHIIHLIVSLIEILLINYIVEYKFSIIHELFHKIKPLLYMCHYEHHITKGIYPTTCGKGIWESFIEGGSVGFTLSIWAYPFFYFQTFYFGGNILYHIMLPYETFVQYHTMHHIINAGYF